MTPLEQDAERLRPIVEQYGYLSTIDALALAAARQSETTEGAFAEIDAAYLVRISDALTDAVKTLLREVPA